MHPRIRYLAFLLLLWSTILAAAGDDFVIRDIRVEGLQRISAGTVFNYLPVKIGDTIDANATPRIIRALYKTGFFKDVHLKREGDVLVVSVTERPAVAKITISGNKDIGTDDLMQALKDIGLAEGRTFNRSVLDRIEQELERQYFSRGKYGVKITSTVSPLERNRVSIEIKIVEGAPARIKQIHIIGNKAFSEEDLLDQFQLGTPGWFSWFSSRDKYSKEKLSGDLERLRSFYLDRGYIDFNIESTQVSITPDKKDIYITIVISEGDVYTIKDIQLAGKLVLEPKSFFPLIHLSRGEIFSRKRVTESADRVNKLLGEHGYAFANVNAIPEIDKEKREVTVTFFVDPGKRVYVRRINMAGNTKTRDVVLRREMRQMESAWFSTKDLRKSRERLERLGYFDEVNVKTRPVPGSPDEIDIDINVKEKPSGVLTAGIGYSQSQGLILNTNITQNNFFGTGKRVSFGFDNSSSNTLYRLGYHNPYYTIDGISRGFEFSYRKTNFDKLATADYATDTGIAAVNFGWPVTDIDRFSFGLNYRYTNFKPGTSVAAQEFADENGNRFNDFLVRLGWSRDSRNRALFPTRGGYQNLSLEASIPWSDLDFYKVRYRHYRYLPLTRDLTFKLGLDLGYGEGYGDTDSLPFFENYFAGGPRSVRGFKANSLGPTESAGNSNTIGGNLKVGGNLELIFPPPMDDFKKTMRVSAFFDIGNVFAVGNSKNSYGNQGFDAGNLRYSVGLSATWISPVGALTLSYAEPLNDEEFDDIEKFQFSLGTTF